MADLYKMLGVKRGAKRADIRKAYRERARKSHPDTGGSAEQFALVKHAHDVLIDEERRQRYDATGDESGKSADNELAECIQVLSIVFDKVLQQIESRGRDPVNYDLVNDMRIMLGGELDNLKQSRRKLEAQKQKIERMLGRFKIKNGDNFFENILKDRVRNAEAALLSHERQEKTGKRALGILKGYSFKHDVSEVAAAASYSMTDLMQRFTYTGL